MLGLGRTPVFCGATLQSIDDPFVEVANDQLRHAINDSTRIAPERVPADACPYRGLLDQGHDHGHSHSMDPVSKGALKAKMLEYLRRVVETGEELIVTDNNVPVVKIVPIKQRRPASEVFADARNRLIYHEDILAPTTDEWTET